MHSLKWGGSFYLNRSVPAFQADHRVDRSALFDKRVVLLYNGDTYEMVLKKANLL